MARTGPMPLCLPDEIVIWEILVRLPPKSLVRCRAMCRAWRRVTSTRHFLLAHHGHQPSLPLLSGYESDGTYDCRLEIIAFDPRSAKLQPLAQLDDVNLDVVASCDGLLIFSLGDTYFSICNPVTRQWGHLPMLSGFYFSGIYPHHPTGEYRLLLYRSQSRKLMYEDMVPGDRDSWYVLTLGCDEVPRCIGWPEVALHGTPVVLVRGSLHWYPARHRTRSKTILAFDTMAESFRLMSAPFVPKSTHLFETFWTHLFETDGMLGLYRHNDAVTMVDVWVMQDYESEVWAFKYRVELPVAKIRGQFEWSGRWSAVVTSKDGDVLVLVHFGQWLLHINIQGKLVASFGHDSQGLPTSLHRLKQSLVQHTFFPALSKYGVNARPFI